MGWWSLLAESFSQKWHPRADANCLGKTHAKQPFPVWLAYIWVFSQLGGCYCSWLREHLKALSSPVCSEKQTTRKGNSSMRIRSLRLMANLCCFTVQRSKELCVERDASPSGKLGKSNAVVSCLSLSLRPKFCSGVWLLGFCYYVQAFTKQCGLV